MSKNQKILTDKEKEDLNKLFKLDYNLIYYAKTHEQIKLLHDLQNLCQYDYKAEYLIIKRENSNEIQREKKKISKAITTLQKYIISKHDDPVLTFLIDTIDKRLDTDLRLSANSYIEQKKMN